MKREQCFSETTANNGFYGSEKVQHDAKREERSKKREQREKKTTQTFVGSLSVAGHRPLYIYKKNKNKK